MSDAGEPDAPAVERGQFRIAEQLAALVAPIDSLSEDPVNARIHGARNVEAIKASLARFGQRKPIVTRNGVCVAGSGTLRAARELGATEIARVEAADLTPEEARAYGIADNKTAELAEWDDAMLGAAFRQMDDELIAFTGFVGSEIERVLSVVPPPEGFKEYDESIETTAKCPRCGYEFTPPDPKTAARRDPGGDRPDGS